MQTPEYSLTRRTLCPARAYSMVYQKLCRGQRRQDGMRRVLKASTMRKLSKRRVGRRHFAQRKIMIPYIFSQPVMFSCHPPPPRHLEVGRPSILDLPPHIYCVWDSFILPAGSRHHQKHVFHYFRLHHGNRKKQAGHHQLILKTTHTGTYCFVCVFNIEVDTGTFDDSHLLVLMGQTNHMAMHLYTTLSQIRSKRPAGL